MDVDFAEINHDMAMGEKEEPAQDHHPCVSDGTASPEIMTPSTGGSDPSVTPSCERKLKVGATVKCMFEECGVVEWLCGTGNVALLAPCCLHFARTTTILYEPGNTQYSRNLERYSYTFTRVMAS
jgi:hypothetical protein